ncbi:hypothetical protein JYU34_009057 [Plutella xylostella]|uniref:Uncharacterized protein n=1 Tax=Plutella xylostella TaxID=51655 RepID=A0ABQ7QMX8_PLUXY|nr:hypothetical protein JYU34_009057 [Plutella xylostella]
MKKEWIALWAVIAIVVLTGGGVLIWWLARSPETSKGYGDIKQHAAFVPIRDVGEMFYWYYPTTETSYPRPLIVWLHGVTDVPPSLAANIGAFGPYDRHLNRRNDSWVEDYNLLFIDAPLGSGFSRLVNRGPHRPTSSQSNGLSGNQKQLRVLAQPDEELVAFMNEEVAAALGVSGNYDEGRQEVVDNFKNSYLNSAVPLVEEILQNTKLTVTIYNGNLDAISSTPGQLEWVNSLKWDGQEEFLNSRRNQVYVNDILEGSVRETDRLKFYWVNAAGQSVPVDSPVAMRRILQSIAGY